jgi:hypothetical protein
LTEKLRANVTSYGNIGTRVQNSVTDVRLPAACNNAVNISVDNDALRFVHYRPGTQWNQFYVDNASRATKQIRYVCALPLGAFCQATCQYEYRSVRKR